jgi:hypothetical protein
MLYDAQCSSIAVGSSNTYFNTELVTSSSVFSTTISSNVLALARVRKVQDIIRTTMCIIPSIIIVLFRILRKRKDEVNGTGVQIIEGC